MFRKLLKINLIYLTTLAIFGTIFYGLLINTLLPIMGITSPLNTIWVWPVYALYVVPLYKLIYEVNQWVINGSTPIFLKIVILINPIISIMGANYVNNGGGAALAISSVLLASLIFIWVLLRSSGDVPDSDRTYKAFIYSASLSLIYAFALRSNYLSGFDIHQEFQVFRLTSANNLWEMDRLRDAYNACLSITILPTIIRNLTGIAELSIFREIYPIFLALIPLGVYTIGTRFLANKLAFSGAFLFLIQAQYFTQLPALLRQGIAFLFFTLLIDSLIRHDVPKKYGQLSVVIFGTGIVLSHYSTTYTTIAILTLAKIAITIGELFILKTRKSTILSIWILSYLIGITFLWNVIITDTAGGLTNTFSKVIQNIGTVFSFENKSDAVKGIIYSQTDNNLAVNNYVEKVISESPNSQKYLDYKIQPISISNGKSVSLKNPIALYFHLVIPWAFRLMILGGFIALIVHYLKYYQTYAVVTIASAMMSVVASMLILPTISVNYNFERLFQQMLVLLAPISVMALWQLNKWFAKFPTYLLLSVLTVSYLIQTSGLASRTFFDMRTWIFDNGGETYYRYYTTKHELAGLSWLDKATEDQTLLYSDKYTRLRVLAYTENKYRKISSEINPPVIQKDGYIYEGFAAAKAGAVFSDARNASLRFSFPSKFVYDYKNQIYSNSISRIYR